MLYMNRCIGTVARMGGVPSILSEFVDSFADLIQWNSQYVCGQGETIYYPRPPRLNIHDVARNMMAESMRGEWILMLDSDHQFEPDILYRLINLADQTDADVVCGFYQFKGKPYIPVVYIEHEGRLAPLCDWDRSGPLAIEVAAAGAGCLWVKKSVFERIDRELKERPFDRIGGNGEDISFFQRLKKLGIKATCNPNIECHHLEIRPVTLDDYDPSDLELHKPEKIVGYR